MCGNRPKIRGRLSKEKGNPDGYKRGLETKLVAYLGIADLLAIIWSMWYIWAVVRDRWRERARVWKSFICHP